MKTWFFALLVMASANLAIAKTNASAAVQVSSCRQNVLKLKATISLDGLKGLSSDDLEMLQEAQDILEQNVLNGCAESDGAEAAKKAAEEIREFREQHAHGFSRGDLSSGG